MEVSLNDGNVVLIDDEDFPVFSSFGYSWHTTNKGYVECTVGKVPNRKNIKLHRVLMNAPDGVQVDHINRNKLDNRKSNLRLCSNGENQRNTGKRSTNSSGYKGVTWKKSLGKWQAQIQFNYKNNHIGYFSDIKEAALAYNQVASQLFGEFAYLNLVEE